jgi:orotidine-5'-phosphate decarboxylase
MKFQDKLDHAIQTKNSLVCVGLDSDLMRIPPHVHKHKFPQFTFSKEIIDRTHDLVCAYKPQSAYFESRGAEGIAELKMICDYIRKTYPDTVLILDAKRADIGTTNEGYLHYAYEYLGADAITLQPYFGREALTPFLDRADKGCIILCRTSNAGAGEFQDLKIDSYELGRKDSKRVTKLTSGSKLYEIVADRVATEWNTNGNCMLVVGATYPHELETVRRIVGDMTLLVPGIGAQGGDLEATMGAGMNSKKAGMVINSSRGIIFASGDKDFAQRAREETDKLKTAINSFR